MLRETKGNVQGTNSDGKETRTQINDLEQKEEINILPKQNEEKRIKKKMRRGLGTRMCVTSNFKYSVAIVRK